MYRPANEDIPDFTALQQATIDFPAGVAQELKVWACLLSLDGAATPLPTLVEIRTGAELAKVDLNLTDGQLLLPLRNQPIQLTLTFPQEN
jgi:hypothetical protein